MATPTAVPTLRSPRGIAAGAACALAAFALAACAPAGGRQAGEANASRPAHVVPTERRANRRELPGAGAVAFDPTGARLAWAAGNEVRILDLRTGEQHRLPAGAWVSDLGFAPDGGLWVVADRPAHWRAGAPTCRADGVEADRLLALDAQGAVVAGYAHSDGAGMLRHQVWLDARCAVTDESTRPLPPEVQDAESDPGEPLRRVSLRPPRSVPRPVPRLPGAAQARAVAASSDGRWWVFDDGRRRSLWEAASR